jgi:ribonuclease Z
MGDLGELNLQTWAGGRREPLNVYGGPGIDRVVNGFNDAYRLDQGYRTTHHGEQVMPSAAWRMVPITVTLDGAPSAAKDRTGLVFDDGSLTVTAIEVNHEPIEPAYAFRFDYKGRSVVISGDLKYHRPLIAASRNADLLVSEAIAENMPRQRRLDHARRRGLSHHAGTGSEHRQRGQREAPRLLSPAAGARQCADAAFVHARDQRRPKGRLVDH